MYIHSVRLINYKSIGDYKESEIIIEPQITAIIGKNESGKSNVLEGLSCINLLNYNDAVYTPAVVNRNCPTGTQNSFVVVLQPNSDDITKGIVGETKIELAKSYYKLTGALATYYFEISEHGCKSLAEYLDSINSNPFQLQNQDLSNYKIYRGELLDTESINVPRRTAALNFMKSQIGRMVTDKRDEFSSKLEVVIDEWKEFIRQLPTVYYRKSDKHLNSVYKYEDAEKELKNVAVNPNSLLREFVKLIGIDVNDFLSAIRNGMGATQNSIRRRIQKAVDEIINNGFNEFYQTEKITVITDFNGDSVSFSVESGEGEAMFLSERSNGLRWYLDTYIDAQSHDIKERNVLYLLDEPGTSLHVNAQKELLNLFAHLVSKGNQVVYTTHSPYMLNIEREGVHRIRAITKSDDGYTRIYKTAYDSRIAPSSQQDTLTPVVSALGMNLKDTFGPAKDKLNIITEGMSDYIYLTTMAKVLDIETDKFVIIPSVGATNCIKISSILHGWGCPYVALFDYDTEGAEAGEHLRKEMLFELGKQYLFVCDVKQEDIDNKTYKTAYMIEDAVTREEIERFCREASLSPSIDKTLKAKLMCNAIEDGSYIIGDVTRENFKALFNRILAVAK